MAPFEALHLPAETAKEVIYPGGGNVREPPFDR